MWISYTLVYDVKTKKYANKLIMVRVCMYMHLLSILNQLLEINYI